MASFLRKLASVPRCDLFLTTKTYTMGSDAYKSIDASLSKAGLDDWDLVLIHAPTVDAKLAKRRGRLSLSSSRTAR